MQEAPHGTDGSDPAMTGTVTACSSMTRSASSTAIAVAKPTLSLAPLALANLKPLSTLRIAFVDDEAANSRLGLRLLLKLGIPASNVTMMKDGEST